MALKFWLHSITETEPWSGGTATVYMTDDTVHFDPVTIPCPLITPAALIAKTAAMPGSLGVTVDTAGPT